MLICPTLPAQDPDANAQPPAEPVFGQGGATVSIGGDIFTIELALSGSSVTALVERDSDQDWRDGASGEGLPCHLVLREFELWLGSEGDDWLGDADAAVPVVCFGFGGDDVLIGGSANDCLIGGAGNDRCLAGAGNDQFWGGVGRDAVFGGPGNDIIAGGPDSDDLGLHDGGVISTAQLVYSGATEGAYGLCGGTGDDWIWGDSQSDIGVYGFWAGLGGIDVICSDASQVESAENVDRLFGAACSDCIYGCPGIDKIWGGNEQVEGDFVDAGGGTDLVWGESGEDVVWGGKGFDQIWGGDNGDTLQACERFDDSDTEFNIIDGERGSDRIYGASKDDKLWGAAGDDTISGGEGVDYILGEDGDDTLFGDEGADLLSCGSGNDVCYGESGDDAIWGGLGRDLLCGGEGNDYLLGGGDSDTLQGDVEPLVILGPGVVGPAGNDKLVDVSGDSVDILQGGAGNDLLIAFDRNTPTQDLLAGEDGQDEFYFDEQSFPMGNPDVLDYDSQFDGALHPFQATNWGDPVGRTEPVRF